MSCVQFDVRKVNLNCLRRGFLVLSKNRLFLTIFKLGFSTQLFILYRYETGNINIYTNI